MWPFKKKKVVRLGSETDDVLLERVREALNALGATCSSGDEVMAGSQEISSFEYRLNGKVASVVIETYEGVSIEGDPDFIDRILLAVNEA